MENITHCYTPKTWEQNVIFVGEDDIDDAANISVATRTS